MTKFKLQTLAWFIGILPEVRRYLRSRFDDPEIVDEVCANLMLAYVEGKLYRIELIENLDERKAYILVVARRMALRLLAKRRFAQFDENMFELIPSPEQDEGDFRLEFLQQCHNKLTPEERKLLHDKYVKGMTVKEIFEAQTEPKKYRTEEAISSELRRLRMRMRECIERRESAETFQMGRN